MKSVRLGNKYFDDREGRYFTVDGTGCDPHVFRCIQEEYGDPGELEITGIVLMHDSELMNMREVTA